MQLSNAGEGVGFVVCKWSVGRHCGRVLPRRSKMALLWAGRARSDLELYLGCRLGGRH